MKKSSVVIVTYNRCELLKECIQCVQSQTVKFDKIIIINNFSTDGTREFLSQFEDNDDFTILSLDENLGGAGGFHYGVKEAIKQGMEWVLLIDDDAMLDNTYNEKIMEAADKYPNILAFSGVVYTNQQIDCEHRSYLASKIVFNRKISKYEDYQNEYFDCELASFCGLMISKELIMEIGYPEKEYFIWYDDTEYSMRIIKRSVIRNINDACINHKTVLSDGKKELSWKDYYGARNRLHMVCKYYGFLGKTYERLKYNYIVYREILRNRIKRNSSKEYKIELFKDASNDALNGRLGKNRKYLPSAN